MGVTLEKGNGGQLYWCMSPRAWPTHLKRGQFSLTSLIASWPLWLNTHKCVCVLQLSRAAAASETHWGFMPMTRMVSKATLTLRSPLISLKPTCSQMSNFLQEKVDSERTCSHYSHDWCHNKHFVTILVVKRWQLNPQPSLFFPILF